MHSSASIKTHCRMFATLPPSTKQGDQLHALAASIGTFLPAREATETAVIEQHNEAPYARANGHERLSYHDDLELNGALLTGGSRH
jgi:hypothetical protein